MGSQSGSRPSAITAEALGVEFATGLGKPPLRALHGVDMTVGAGEIVGVLGPNGSGKTTLLNVLAGLLPPSTGKARVLGRSPQDRALVQRVGVQLEGPLPFPALSGREFLQYMGDLMHLPKVRTKATSDVWLERFELGHAANRSVRQYSTGMCRRLALAAALMADPEVLLLDEPTAGLDPAGSMVACQAIRERAEAGCTVLLASHHMQEVEQVCDRVYVLERGQVAQMGTLDELLGTGDQRLVVRGLDSAGMTTLEAAVEAAGGEVVDRGANRKHLFALFRKLGRGASK